MCYATRFRFIPLRRTARPSFFIVFFVLFFILLYVLLTQYTRSRTIDCCILHAVRGISRSGRNALTRVSVTARQYRYLPYTDGVVTTRCSPAYHGPGILAAAAASRMHARCRSRYSRLRGEPTEPFGRGLAGARSTYCLMIHAYITRI